MPSIDWPVTSFVLTMWWAERAGLRVRGATQFASRGGRASLVSANTADQARWGRAPSELPSKRHAVADAPQTFPISISLSEATSGRKNRTMWLEAILSKDNVVSLVRDFLPLSIHLGENLDDGHYLELFESRDVSLIEGQGLRMSCGARIRWPILGIDLPVTVESVTLLLCPSFPSRPTTMSSSSSSRSRPSLGVGAGRHRRSNR
jgi:hypothetical protein